MTPATPEKPAAPDAKAAAPAGSTPKPTAQITREDNPPATYNTFRNENPTAGCCSSPAKCYGKTMECMGEYCEDCDDRCCSQTMVERYMCALKILTCPCWCWKDYFHLIPPRI